MEHDSALLPQGLRVYFYVMFQSRGNTAVEKPTAAAVPAAPTLRAAHLRLAPLTNLRHRVIAHSAPRPPAHTRTPGRGLRTYGATPPGAHAHPVTGTTYAL
jgi:hypothetical protein